MPPVPIRNATSLACHWRTCQPQESMDTNVTSFNNYQLYVKVLIMLMGLRDLALVIIVQLSDTFFWQTMLLFFLGETKALMSVSGPIKVQLAAENPSRVTFEVSVHTLSNVLGTDAKSLLYTMCSLLSPLSCSLKTCRYFFSSLYNHSPRYSLLHFSLCSLQPWSMPVHLCCRMPGVSKCEGLFVLFLLAICCTALSSCLVSSLVQMNQMKKNLHHWTPEDALHSCSHQVCKWYEITGVRCCCCSWRTIFRVPLISCYKAWSQFGLLWKQVWGWWVWGRWYWVLGPLPMATMATITMMNEANI